MSNKFSRPVTLVPLSIPNDSKEVFRDKLLDVPYLLYEVEQISTGQKIVINKPGGKRSFGRLSKDDFMVFIYTPATEELWLIKHAELYADCHIKLRTDVVFGQKVIAALEEVCKGKEPDILLEAFEKDKIIGLSVELLLKVYKWIWGQEDVNYPKAKGRWLSMDPLLELANSH